MIISVRGIVMPLLFKLKDNDQAYFQTSLVMVVFGRTENFSSSCLYSFLFLAPLRSSRMIIGQVKASSPSMRESIFLLTLPVPLV
jgi:hypothetical protein